MNHPLNRGNVLVTLEKPLRAQVPVSRQIGRVLAFRGRLKEIVDGWATYEATELYFHPDDLYKVDGVGLVRSPAQICLVVREDLIQSAIDAEAEA